MFHYSRHLYGIRPLPVAMFRRLLQQSAPSTESVRLKAKPIVHFRLLHYNISYSYVSHLNFAPPSFLQGGAKLETAPYLRILQMIDFRYPAVERGDVLIFVRCDWPAVAMESPSIAACCFPVLHKRKGEHDHMLDGCVLGNILGY